MIGPSAHLIIDDVSTPVVVIADTGVEGRKVLAWNRNTSHLEQVELLKIDVVQAPSITGIEIKNGLSLRFNGNSRVFGRYDSVLPFQQMSVGEISPGKKFQAMMLENGKVVPRWVEAVKYAPLPKGFSVTLNAPSADYALIVNGFLLRMV